LTGRAEGLQRFEVFGDFGDGRLGVAEEHGGAIGVNRGLSIPAKPEFIDRLSTMTDLD
jgi:hypothetical protein